MKAKMHPTMSISFRIFHQQNDRDQRAAEVDIDLTKNRTTAAPLHPMVLPFSALL
jgi:hypothetical protein